MSLLRGHVGLLLTVLLCLVACTRRTKEPPPGPIEVTFEYLPAHHTTRVTLYQDRMRIRRTHERDSLVEDTVVVLDTGARVLGDSVRTLLAGLSSEVHTKKNVFDGTLIRIRGQGKKIECNNCLNDFVLKASGMHMPSASPRLVRLRDLVATINTLVMRVDQTRRAPYRSVAVSRPSPDHDSSAYVVTLQGDSGTDTLRPAVVQPDSLP